ncbi:hypothetical protein CsSME_00043192 [Camellia sinensis var. sinensis]
MSAFGILLKQRKRKNRRRRDGSENARTRGPKEISESSGPPRPLLQWSFCFTGDSGAGRFYISKWFVFSISWDDLKEEEDRRRRRCQSIVGDIPFQHDCRHDGERRPMLSPIQIHEDLRPFAISGTCWTTLGSIVYCLGGGGSFGCDGGDLSLCRSREVRYFDINRPTEGWKEAPPMINPRSEAKVVALHGKLYVFGGSDCGGDWAEVFEPCGPDGGGQGQWTALPSTPSRRLPLSDCLFAAAGSPKNQNQNQNHKILVGSEHPCRVYEFDVTRKYWVRLKSDSWYHLRLRCSFCQPVLVDNTLYSVDDSQLNAYDLNEKILFSGPIEDLSIHVLLQCEGYDSRPAFLHLAGQYFCLLWVVPDESSSDSCLHCTIFRVSKNTDVDYRTGTLSASVLSCHSCLLNRHLKFVDGLLL